MRHKSVLVICCMLFCSVILISFSQKDHIISNTRQDRRPNTSSMEIRTADPSFIEKVASNWSASWDGAVYDMTIDSDDNVYVAGITPSKDAYLKKYNPLGELLKTVTWGGSAYDSGLAVAIDSNSNVYLSGDTQSFGFPGIENCFLAQYNENLVQQWNITWYISGENDMVDMVIDSEDNVVVLGNYEIFGSFQEDLFIRKYNATGHLVWEIEWGGGLDDYPYKSLIDSEDNAYIWARSYDPGPGPSYMYILKVNSSGQAKLLKEYSKYPIFDLALDSEDNLIVLGHFYTGKNTLRKYDNEFISYTQYTEWSDYEIYDYNLALDGQDNMYVGGGWYCLMKFNDTGVNYWKFTKGESYEQYWLSGIAVDSKQNIYCLLNNWSNSHLYMYDNSSHAVTCLKTPKFAAKELYATIVGCGNYYGEDYDLPFVYRDRQAMVEHLRKDCNVPSQNIESLADARNSDIENALTAARSLSEEDDYLFYFSGHGGEYSGDSCIYPYDSLPPYSSSYRFDCDDLDWYLDRIECESAYVFIDACHSGGFTTSNTEPGEFIISSCKQSEVSIETYELGHGTFTYYFLDSFANANDDNEDGLISLEERYTYISSQTAAFSDSYGVNQHPQLYDGISGYSAFHPSADMRFEQDESTVIYDLTVHGSGQIYDMFLDFYSDTNVWTVNLSANARESTTGFDTYTGMFSAGEDEVQRCILTMDVKGEQYLTVSATFYPEEEDEEEEIVKEAPAFNFFLITIIIVLAIVAIGGLYVVRKKYVAKTSLKKMRSFSKDSPAETLQPRPGTSVQVSVAGRYCVFCGRLINTQNAYCTHCGKKVLSK